MRSRLILAVCLVSLLQGCSKREPDATPGASASSLAPSAPASVKAMKFAIDPKSKTSIDMPAPKEHIKGETDVAGGAIDVDPQDLANTRGEI